MPSIKTLGFVIPTLSLGGAERVVVRLAEGLATDFRCYIFIRRGGARLYPVAGVEVVELDYSAASFESAVEQYGIDLYFDHYHWDADHVRMMAALADAGVPVVLTEHNAFHYPLFQAAHDRKRGYENYFNERYEYYRKFSAVTLLNQDACASFAEHLDNLRVIANPISYEPDGVADHYARTIINVSSFGKAAKRLDLLYAAYAQVRSTHADAGLRIVGEYNYINDQYYRRISGLGDAAVQCVGRSRNVAQHYNQSSLFALSSSIEGQPMVLLEAAMHAMPSVAFDLPGLRDQIVDGETGFLVPFGDTGAFADAVSSLLGNPRRLRDMGYAARAKTQRDFALQPVLEIWRGLIADIARDGRIHSELIAPAPADAARAAVWTDYWLGVGSGAIRSTPKVSFLVPVYDTEDVLPRCLRSIQEQVLRDFECIVVDDASPGDVMAVVNATVGNDKRFRVIRHEKNRGLYQARSTAADAATGLFFANVDSDDYIHPLFAEKLFREAISTGSDIVECRAIELGEEGRPIRFNSGMRPGPVDGHQASAAYFNGSLRNVVWNKIYARETWWAARDHNEIDIGLTITEDTLRNTFLFPRCQRYSAIEDCLYFYCRRGNSVVKGGDIHRLAAKLADIDKSYTLARHHARDVLRDPHALLRLEDRRCEDSNWYIAEFLARSPLSEVREKLLADTSEPGDRSLLLMYLVSHLADTRADLKQRRDAWAWEYKRANKLQQKLRAVRDIVSPEDNAK